MGAWRRLGIVLSVIWAFGLPFCIAYDHNRRTGNEFVACATRSTAGYETCKSIYEPRQITMFQLFSDPVMMGLVSVPILALWLIGGVIKWIAGGFRQQPSHRPGG